MKSVKILCYFVLGSDSTCNVYINPWGEIQDDISVDYSTISKKIKRK